WVLFGLIWGLALVGMIIDSLPNRGRRLIPLAIYAIMGWLCLIAVKPLYAALTPEGFWWLLAGGLCYTGGIGFFVLDERIRHFHGIWHLFVMAGSICHYICILGYVI
ncbi:MAG: hemolysin III family protein, partial [Corallincola sp.]|nr:hemolysin III family protein [Corallincola sp.]